MNPAPEQVESALRYAEVGEIYNCLQTPEALKVLAAEVRRLQADRDAWKASHDNQVELKRQLMDRPDLKERVSSLVKLHAALSASDALCGGLRDALDEAETIVAEHYGAGHPLRVKIASALAKTPEDAGAEVERLNTENTQLREDVRKQTDRGNKLQGRINELAANIADSMAALKGQEHQPNPVASNIDALRERIETAEARNERLVAAGNAMHELGHGLAFNQWRHAVKANSPAPIHPDSARLAAIIAAGDAMRNTGEAMADLPGFIHTRKPNQHPAFTDWDKSVELYDAAKTGAQMPDMAALLEDKADLDWLEKEILGGDVSLGHYPFAEPNKERKWALVRGYIEHYADTARTAIRAARKEAR